MQETYRPSRSKCLLCCSVGGGGVIPVLSWPGGTPFLGTSPIGTGVHPGQGWGTPLERIWNQRPGTGYPQKGPGTRDLRMRGVTMCNAVNTTISRSACVKLIFCNRVKSLDQIPCEYDSEDSYKSVVVDLRIVK